MQTYPAAPVMMAFLPSKRRPRPPELIVGLMLFSGQAIFLLFLQKDDGNGGCQKVGLGRLCLGSLDSFRAKIQGEREREKIIIDKHFNVTTYGV